MLAYNFIGNHLSIFQGDILLRSYHCIRKGNTFYTIRNESFNPDEDVDRIYIYEPYPGRIYSVSEKNVNDEVLGSFLCDSFGKLNQMIFGNPSGDILCLYCPNLYEEELSGVYYNGKHEEVKETTRSQDRVSLLLKDKRINLEYNNAWIMTISNI